MSYGTADEAAENIACAGIRRNEFRGITDEHDACSGVVCQDTHGACQLLVRIILHTGSLFDIGDRRSVKVDLIYIVQAVQECQDTLQSPACINILLRKRCQGSVLMLLVLHEYVVTDLGIFSTVASRAAVRTAGRNVLYIEHLTVRAARTVLQSPPVILGRKIENVFRLKSGLDTVFRALFISRSILVTGENSRCQVICVKAEKFSQKLEAPLASFFLKIVAQRPGTHHFEEGSVALITDRVDIICTDTALDITKSCTEGVFLAQKVRHQRLHAGDIKHNTR